MSDTPTVATISALIGDPTRVRMLMALMDGRALTATELALDGGVGASTASSHLARLRAAGLVALAKQGRHRYFRLAGPEIASVLEGVLTLAGGHDDRVIVGPRDAELRRARVCYDHLAGETAVRLLAGLRAKRFLSGDDDGMTLTAAGEEWSESIGIDVGALRTRRRPLCLSCLDWSERRMHLAGALGAAILDRLLALGYAHRKRGTRALVISALGNTFLKRVSTDSS